MIHCEPVPTQSSNVSKRLQYGDFNYESIVGTVRLAPIRGGVTDALGNPLVQLNTSDRLFLEFDLLTDQFEYLAAKIIHCNLDWKPSLLRDMEFLNEINNYRVSNYDYSINTTQPYIRYQLDVTKPKISGNYILAIHRRGNPNDVLFTRKFLVVNNVSNLNHQVRSSTVVSKRNTHQQIDFDLSYGNLQVNNPMEDISVVLLQNHNWNAAITGLKPTLIRPNENYMEFRLLDGESCFQGWNEFRFFDLRTLNVTGRNLARIQQIDGKTHAWLGTDASRGNQVYTQNLRDINGNFIIENTDLGEVPLNADYATVHFNLKTQKMNGDVYVIGRFNNWALSGENLMRYNPSTQTYQTSILLKQGYYDYQFLLNSGSEPSYSFEGSHFQAENTYEILVYYRQPGNINDELVGYKQFNTFINN